MFVLFHTECEIQNISRKNIVKWVVSAHSLLHCSDEGTTHLSREVQIMQLLHETEPSPLVKMSTKTVNLRLKNLPEHHAPDIWFALWRVMKQFYC